MNREHAKQEDARNRTYSIYRAERTKHKTTIRPMLLLYGAVSAFVNPTYETKQAKTIKKF
jgi:hypothetical protein